MGKWSDGGAFAMSTEDERRALRKPEQIDLGTYRSGPPVREFRFTIDLDARPLVTLLDAAEQGRRVYELMTIRRPGDVLHYFWVKVSSTDTRLIRALATAKPPSPRDTRDSVAESIEAPLVAVDRSLFTQDEDAHPAALSWTLHRTGSFWRDKMLTLYRLICRAQLRLRDSQDFLTRHELQRIDDLCHWRDFQSSIDRRTELDLPRSRTDVPAEVLARIKELVTQSNVRSVSCLADHYGLWRFLVEQQVRRANNSGLPPQQTLALCGPDSGLTGIDANDWGGEIHIPYEGVCDGDLYICPARKTLNHEHTGLGGNLSWAFGKDCHYVLTPIDHGYLGCALRTPVGSWVLYESNRPYVPAGPLGHAQAQQIEEGGT